MFSWRELLSRVVVWCILIALWGLTVYQGLYQTALLTNPTKPWISALSILFLLLNLAMIWYSFRKGFLDVLLLIGLFWLSGTAGILWELCTGNPVPILGISALPLVVGMAYDGVDQLWYYAVFAVVYSVLPILCGVQIFRLWKKAKKNRNSASEGTIIEN